MSKIRVNPLDTIDADTLMTTSIPVIRYVVDQLLPQRWGSPDWR